MTTEQDVRDWLQAGIDCAHLEVHGPDGVHFQALIVSDEFIDKSVVQRHQIVYRCLGDRMGGIIHALSMKTLTVAEWKR